MNKGLLLTLKIIFIIWALVIFFFYYRTEIAHNLDHLPVLFQKIAKEILFLK